MSNATPYYVPPEPARFHAVILAVLVHAILLAFLWIGIDWANDKPEPIEAEVWSTTELEAAQAPAAIPPPDSPVAPKETTPAPPPKVEQPPVDDRPDIALETEKKRLKEEKKKQEELAKQRAATLAQQKEEEQDRKQAQEDAKKEAQDKLLKKQQLAEAKRKQDDRDKQIRDAFHKGTDNDIKPDPSTKPGNGTASRSQGKNTDKKWGDAVTKKIKSNIDFHVPTNIDNNPSVSFEVSLLPDGSILSIHQTKSSGLPEFDKAVRQAIEISAPYPKDSTGVVPTPFTSTHYLKD